MTLRIGQLADRARVNVQTVRFYERRGLIAEPERTPAGYRQYADDEVRRIRFIKRAQELGFSLSEIQELLELRIRHPSACATVEAKTRRKIDLVDQKIAELERIKRGLERLAASCQARRPTGDCPILETLDEDANA
ncbi:MAG: MerR family transcriptional regulator [Gemmatimonadales bacterium]